MIEGLRNMAGHASHIRVVGPHAHEWVTVKVDGRGDKYRECFVCGTRTCDSQGEPLRKDWLSGAPWDAEPVAAVAAAEPEYDERPRRGRPPKRG